MIDSFVGVFLNYFLAVFMFRATQKICLWQKIKFINLVTFLINLKRKFNLQEVRKKVWIKENNILEKFLS